MVQQDVQNQTKPNNEDWINMWPQYRTILIMK